MGAFRRKQAGKQHAAWDFRKFALCKIMFL